MLPEDKKRFDSMWQLDDVTQCQVWAGGFTQLGYPLFYHNYKQEPGHRAIYKHLNGEIPKTCYLMQTCRNKRCVNPDHLKLISRKDYISEGFARKHKSEVTHCPKGHSYNETNTAVYVKKDGSKYRACKICRSRQSSNHVRNKKRNNPEYFKIKRDLELTESDRKRLATKWKLDLETNCWVWIATKNTAGYGHFSVKSVLYFSHRITYQFVFGPIPEGLELDHLCRRPECCNPLHLEPVTRLENARRGAGGKYHSAKTHCPKGHPYSQENTYVHVWEKKDGRTVKSRACRTCKNKTTNDSYHRMKRKKAYQSLFNDI